MANIGLNIKPKDCSTTAHSTSSVQVEILNYLNKIKSVLHRAIMLA